MTDRKSPTAIRPSHLRVDVGGVAVYVRSDGEYQHLIYINRKLAIAKLALHKIRASNEERSSGYATQAIDAMKETNDAQ